jgi:hypothetical protein
MNNKAARNDEPQYWFPVKKYGWGWGLPRCWQGAVVFFGYLALLILGVRHYGRQHDRRSLVICAVILTILFVAVVAIKGEKPVGWRWGKK